MSDRTDKEIPLIHGPTVPTCVFCPNYADGAGEESSVLITSNIGEWVAHVNNNLICAGIVIDITEDLIKTT